VRAESLMFYILYISPGFSFVLLPMAKTPANAVRVYARTRIVTVCSFGLCILLQLGKVALVEFRPYGFYSLPPLKPRLSISRALLCAFS
jgi:hypothetical protein